MRTSHFNFRMAFVAVLLLCMLMFPGIAAAQTAQAGIFVNYSTAVVTVKAKVSGGDLTTSVSTPFAIVVTMRYLTSYGITVGTPTGPFGITLDATYTNGSYTYKVYACVTTTTANFLNGIEYDLFSVGVSGGSGYGTFQLMNDAFTMSVYGEWYFEYAANDYTNYTTPFYQSTASGVPLPVELVLFTGNRSGDRVTLDWKTASELNNSGFDVERSSDNTAWRKLNFVRGHGTTDQPHSYTYIDNLQAETAAESVLYYRLRQLDRDGRHTYSEVVTVTKPRAAVPAAPASARLLPAYPNPFPGGDGGAAIVVIPLLIDQEQAVTLCVTSSSGEIVQWIYSDEVLSPGTYRREFNATALPSGVYFVVLQTADRTVRQKIVYAK